MHSAGVARFFDVTRLPSPALLRARHISLCLVDEGLGGPACFYWLDDAPNGPLAYWESGGGDHYFARFWAERALLWGFNRDSPLHPAAHPDEPEEWPGMTDGLPARYKEVIDAEPDEAYRTAVSFVFWHDGTTWRSHSPEPPDWEPGDDLDLQGAEFVLERVLSTEAAAEHLARYHERPELQPQAAVLIAAAERGVPLTVEVLAPFASAIPPAALGLRAESLGLRTAL
jgi:hypothetical protein